MITTYEEIKYEEEIKRLVCDIIDNIGFCELKNIKTNKSICIVTIAYTEFDLEVDRMAKKCVDMIKYWYNEKKDVLHKIKVKGNNNYDVKIMVIK